MEQPFDEIVRKLKTVPQCEPEECSRVLRAYLESLAAKAGSWESEQRARDNTEVMLEWDPAPILAPGVPGDTLGFADFKVDPKYPTLQQALEMAHEWAGGAGPGILVLSGPPGVGKTFLAKAAAAYLQGLNRLVVYRVESRLIGELQGLMSGGGPSVEECQLEYGQMRWLVIDEFGGTHTRDWGSGVIDRIINDRWDNESCRTMITTNLLGDDMPVRIRSRLGDATRARSVVIHAPDYRKRER